MELGIYPRLVYGALKSYLPIDYTSWGTGGTTSAHYCYSVWLRHLVSLRNAGLIGPDHLPRTIVELGPGDSIGTGIAALLSGCERYIALDVLPFAQRGSTLRIFQELVAMFAGRAEIPDADFPGLHPRVTTSAFPSDILTEDRLALALAPHRLEALERSLTSVFEPGGQQPAGSPGSTSVRYVCPWQPTSIEPETADLVLSQAVLQDMESSSSGRGDLEAGLAAMAQWLRPGGVMSHQIDFSHPLGREWNAHWRLGDTTWRLIRGRRPYYYNRLPLSGYQQSFARAGFRMVATIPVHGTPAAPREALAPRFRDLPAADLVTSSAYLVAVRT